MGSRKKSYVAGEAPPTSIKEKETHVGLIGPKCRGSPHKWKR